MDRSPIAVWSADPLTLSGLVALLARHPELRVVPFDNIADCQVAIVATTTIDPDVAEALKQAAAASSARVILLANELTHADLKLAARCRVVSILPRDSKDSVRLVGAITDALPGPALPSATAMEHLMNQVEGVQHGLFRPRGLSTVALAPRERALLRLLANGLDTGEIASELSYSERTVKNIIQSMLGRLNLKNRSHAVAFAVRCGAL